MLHYFSHKHHSFSAVNCITPFKCKHHLSLFSYLPYNSCITLLQYIYFYTFCYRFTSNSAYFYSHTSHIFHFYHYISVYFITYLSHIHYCFISDSFLVSYISHISFSSSFANISLLLSYTYISYSPQPHYYPQISHIFLISSFYCCILLYSSHKHTTTLKPRYALHHHKALFTISLLCIFHRGTGAL